MKDYVSYWQLWHHNWDNADLKAIQQFSNIENKDVVEIGCADGRLTFQLAPLCQSIVGIDIEPRFIAIANEKAALAKQSNVRFIEGDAEKLPLQSKTIDLVLFPWSLHEIPNTAQALAEAYRILKDDGQLFVIALESNSDYEKIINSFVDHAASNDQNIDSILKYENPIKEIFGSFTNLTKTKNIPPFRYFFDSRKIAYDAFDFALDYWCKTKLDQAQQIKLRQIIDQYWTGNKIELAFPAAVYLAKKISKSQ